MVSNANVRRCFRLFVATLTAPLACTEAQVKQGEAQQPSWVAVVGHWSTVDDSGLGFKMDGTQWSGTTDRAHLERAGTELFQSVPEDFFTNTQATQAFPLAVWNPVADFSQGTVRVRFKLVGGASDQTAGIVIGLRPSGEYLFVRYNTKDGNVAVWEYAAGQRRVLAHGHDHVQLPLNAWHELSVTVARGKVHGSVTGQPISVEHVLDQPLRGRVGVWTKRDAITVFGDLRLTK